MSAFTLDKSFNPQEFIEKYWQKKPVLLPGLLSNFQDPIEPEEIAGLACEDFIDSRLIRLNAEQDWDMQQGPIAEKVFQNMPGEDWTVLVQAVDQWSEAVAELKASFDFIPSWRIDDIMVSYAAPGGGVGPHFDFYDVFLVQGAGQRRWSLGEHCAADAPLTKNKDLRILESFTATQEFILNPGDVLYVPPQYSHWGTAISESLCYSVGFRAPSVAEMLEGYTDSLIARADPAQRFTDSSSRLDSLPGEILSSSLEQPLAQLITLMSQPSNFAKWFGCHVSNPKYAELIQALEEPLSAAQVSSAISDGQSLVRHPCSRFAFMRDGDAISFFADGAVHLLSNFDAQAISTLCETSILESTQAAPLLASTAGTELLTQLINQGRLILE